MGNVFCIKVAVYFMQTMPHFAASDLGLNCLPISFYGTLGING